MSLLQALEVNSSALTAERRRLEVIVSNLANANTTRTPEGGPYRRRDVVFTSTPVGGFSDRLQDPLGAELQGVQVSDVTVDTSPPQRKYDPGHPDADKEGYVLLPNINPVEEMVNLVSAARSFQANVAAITSIKSMMQKSLDIIR